MSSNNSDNLVENSIKFDKNFIIKLANENSNQIIDRNAMQICKILQISSQLDNDQKLAIISTLEPSEYPNLFIFFIEHQNGNFLNENQGTQPQQLEECLRKFGAARPLIIQQICGAENKTKFYYKTENSSEFVDIDQHYPEDYELYKQWQHILSSLDKELQPFVDEMLIKLAYIKDSSIILRFLRTLNLPESFFETLVRYIAVKGSKADLLAILDASFEDNGRVLSDQAQNYIKQVFEDDESGSESDEVESTSEKADQDQDSETDGTSTQSTKTYSSQSVLLTAVQHSNQEIIDYLVTYWTHLIQQLPVEHQIRISTTAYDDNQHDVLCDLLEFSDFPFPDGFNVSNDQVSHERLQNIITDRIKFHEAIEQENEKEIKDFIENNLSMKFIYSPQNITAMKKAIDSKKYKIYYYLKSFGLCASEFRNLEEVLDETELSIANDQADVQTTESISDAIYHASKSVLILCTRALIHNRKVKKEDETKYRKHIKKWLEDINKIAGIMLDVAASCDNLVIIFDFESKYVDRTAFRDNALGLSSDTVSSRIFIGAKLGDSKREQEIKGVLAHELCHYVMSLVFENKFLPYYKHALDIRDWFDEIVKSIDKWSTNDPEPPDDECDGIISSVFRYKKEQFNRELIVRAVQILVLYDDDPKKTAYLQEKYQELFDFWFNLVLPELHKYLQKNKVVIRINSTVELLSSLSKNKIEFKASKDMEQLTKNRIIIVTTNVPKLLLVNMYSHLENNCGCLLKSQNVFIEPEKIKNAQVWKDIKHLYAKDVNLNIFVDCTKGKLDNLSSILKIEEFNFILVASNKEQIAKLNEICIKKDIVPIIININYNWGDLTEECQHKLLQTEITFQNNSKVSLIQILAKNTNPDQNEVKEIIEDFSNTINVHALNLIINRQEISINSNVDDSNKINFEILFRNRNFLKKGINFKNEVSQEILISITANQKHVLISDIAGSGKSWVVRNISALIMKQDPTRWVTYVDLKQFIENFKKQPENLEFANYFIENILKPKTEFEAKIFKKLYKDGKVSIIFDGFDEIAPDCAEFVADLAKLFEFNDGNQLWIVTRDYFEVNLQKKLQIDNVYKLSEFTEKDGINFIVASWILTDLKDQTVADFENHIQSSPNLSKYQEKAFKIVQKVTMSKNQSIGLPQLFSMIADAYKNDERMVGDLKGAKIFTQFVNTMYTRWADFKGILRKEASVQSQDYELNFKELHQYCALLSLFPELVDILFPDYDISEWPEVEIIAGGFLNKIGSSYSFNHETFREYFVADFIFKAIKKPKIKKAINELLIKVLTIRKYGIIRMFLNDFIESYSIMEKVQLELEKSVENFNNMENLSEYFTENLEHLATCVIEILKKGDYDKIKMILSNNVKDIASKTKDLNIFSMFTEFLFSYLSDKDLNDMINSQNILHKIIGSSLDAEIVEYFVLKLEVKADREFVQQQLKLMPSGPENGNIFYHLGTSQNLTENKVQKCFVIIQKYFDDSEIVKLLDKCNEDGQTILKILITNSTNFQPFIEGGKCIFTNENFLQKFKNIVNETDSIGQNILHWSAAKDDINFHTSLWKFIQKTFENQEELKTFVFQKNESTYNFLHCLLIEKNKTEIIKRALDKLKEILSNLDYREILITKGRFGRNLLQLAAICSNEVKTHQIFWKELRDSCKSDQEFLKILEEVDEDDDYVFHLAAACTTSEVFEFIEKELAKVASREEIRKLFIKLGKGNSNLLQAAAVHNKSLEHHKTIWEIIRKYFNPSEILEFIKHPDVNKNNLLVNVIVNNMKEVVELTWKEIKKMLENNNLINQIHKDNIQKCENMVKSIIIIARPNLLQREQKEFLILNWIKNENSEALKLFEEVVQRSLERNLNITKFENLLFLVTDENVENHEKLWENLVKIYKTPADLKKLLSEITQNGDNFIHLLVIFNTPDVIKFTINKLKENLNESDYQEILKSKGQKDRNLLQIAAVRSNELQTYQILWQTFRDLYKSNEEFLKILKTVDNIGLNVFHIAASLTNGEIFEFMEVELAKITSRDEIRKLLIILERKNRNLLQSAAVMNNYLEFHKIIWKIIQKYFNPSEILEFIKHPDEIRENLLIITKKWNTKEILELTWMEVEKVITVLFTDTETVQKIKKCKMIIKKVVDLQGYEIDEIIGYKEIELLSLEWIRTQNTEPSNLFSELTQDMLRNSFSVQNLDDLLLMVNKKSILFHEKMWQHLLKTFDNRQNLAKLLIEKDQYGYNFIHHLVILNTADVIEFTIQKIKENLSESDYQEILRSKGYLGRNLLQLAAIHAKEVKTHNFFWKTIRDSFESDEEFLKIVEEVDEDGGNSVFYLAAAFTTNEIFKFIQNELEKIANHEKIKKFLVNLGDENKNLLQAAAFYNISLELHEAIWEIVEKYFNSSEILQYIKHRDDNGWNLLLNVVTRSTKEVKELTWNKIRNILITFGYENNDNFNICDEIITKDKGFDKLTNEEKKVLKLDWIDSTNSVKLFEDNIQLLIQKEISDISLKDLISLIADDNVENHKILWKYLEEKLSNYQEMKKLFFEKDRHDNNFIHLLVIKNTADVIEFTFQKLKVKLNDSDYQEILRLNAGYYRQNLLQLAAAVSKEVKTHQTLWKALRDSCKSNEEFLEIVSQFDKQGSDVFNIAASFTTAEIFEFMEKELAKITTRDEIRKIFINLGRGNRNLLQSAAVQNKYLDLHETLWKILQKYFSSSELLKLIILSGENNLLKLAIERNVNEVLEFTWTKVKQILINLYTDTETVEKIDHCEKLIQKVLKSDIKSCIEEEMEILNILNKSNI